MSFEWTEENKYLKLPPEETDYETGNSEKFLQANQARALTQKALDAINEELYTRTNSWILSTCEATIRSMSSTGQKQALITIPNNLDLDYLKAQLEVAGYEAQYLNSYSQIKIDWDENSTTTDPSAPSIPDSGDDGTDAD